VHFEFKPQSARSALALFAAPALTLRVLCLQVDSAQQGIMVVRAARAIAQGAEVGAKCKM